jgi:hypothetical protein
MSTDPAADTERWEDEDETPSAVGESLAAVEQDQADEPAFDDDDDE